jgi:predicted ATPase with chaperone activity
MTQRRDTEEVVRTDDQAAPFGLSSLKILEIAPTRCESVRDTGLSSQFLNELAVKWMYYQGSATGAEVCTALRLPFVNVIETIIDFAVDEKLVELTGGKGFGRVSTTLTLTQKGRELARDALSRNAYVGPAPVPLEQYTRVIAQQSQTSTVVTRRELDAALAHVVLPEDLLQKLGPAVNSGRSLFLYGPAGNGKTTIAEAVSSLFRGEAFVPYALEIDGQVVKVFDSLVHHAKSLEADSAQAGRRQVFEMDDRWQLCERPSVVVGGELTLETLDLIYSPTARFYEAPFQVKANGGMLLIDDFGRQKVDPSDLLNRWIVPLEKRIDFLTLHTGKKFEIPFEQLLVFSTNLNPKDLVDEAFLRRIRYKIEVPNPDEAQYREIFTKVCRAANIEYRDDSVTQLLELFYKPKSIGLRACHPRDLLHLVRDQARFLGREPSLTFEALRDAAGVFLVGQA